MKKIRILLFAFLFPTIVCGQKVQLDDILADKYLSGKASPVSFKIGNTSSDLFLSGLKTFVTKSVRNGIVYRTIEYKNPNGISLRIEAKFYLDYNAVEWVGWLKNNASSNSQQIANIDVCNILTALPSLHKDTVYWNRGDLDAANDFEPQKNFLKDDGTPFIFGTENGRSSEKDCMPYYHLFNGEEGIMAAIGWSGSWNATVSRLAENVKLTAGFSRSMNFYLKPGEEVRTPSIVLLFWKGNDRYVGHNLFRRLVLHHFAPQQDGKPVQIPISLSLGSSRPEPCVENDCNTEELCLAIIKRGNMLGFKPDQYWLDAGWYTCPPDNWQAVGTWVPDDFRFPHGLAPIGKLAKSYGEGFMVWFEPERVKAGTWIVKNHPEWLLSKKGGKSMLVDFGKPEVVEAFSSYVSDFIQKSNMTFYRQDFNLRPAPYWKENDEEGRAGIHEIKHVMGLYQYWDNLLARNPGLHIDNCSSGGKRLDIELLKRSVVLHRQDYEDVSAVRQCGTYALSLFLPHISTHCGYIDQYNFRSSITNGVVVGWNINNLTFPTSKANDLFAELREIRGYFYDDYYPLTPYSIKENVWMAYQYDNPEKGDGIAFFFRREQASETQHFRLHGLNPKSIYHVFFKDFGITKDSTGKELMEEGFDVTLREQPSSLLIQYKKIK